MKDFIFTLLAWLITLPLIVASVAFALYNQDVVSITLNPFKDPVTLAVYVPVLAGIAFGFFFGSLMTWAAMGRLRKERRDQKKRIKTLEKQIDAANQNAVAMHNDMMLPSPMKDRI